MEFYVCAHAAAFARRLLGGAHVVCMGFVFSCFGVIARLDVVVVVVVVVVGGVGVGVVVVVVVGGVVGVLVLWLMFWCYCWCK